MERKLVAMFCGVLLLLASGCNETLVNGEEEATEPVAKEVTFDRAETAAIFEAANQDIPIDARVTLTIGVLDRERTNTSVLVLYHNQRELETYRFVLRNGTWVRGELIEQEVIGASDDGAGKTSVYTNSIATIYWEDNGFETVRESDWFINDKTTSGLYSVQREYVTKLATKAKCLEGTMENNGKRWTVDFFQWEWERTNAVSPSFSTQTSFSCTKSTKFTQGSNTYPSNRVKQHYDLEVVTLSPPSVPTLLFPSNNALANASGPVNWSASSGSPTPKYDVQIDNNSNFSSPEVDAEDVSGTSKSYSNLTVGTTYYWRVRATNSQGSSNWTSSWTIRIRPATPNVTSSISGDHPRLSWSSITGATSYKIYRKSYANSSWEYWGSTSSTSYTDTQTSGTGWTIKTGINPSDEWFRYKVEAITSQGWNSNEGLSKYFVRSGGGPE